jgi:uncharacterized SAM-dependent methyltransferase
MLNSSVITFNGLLGMYEDCILWVEQKRSYVGISYLCLGNSNANFSREEATAIIPQFLQSSSRSRPMRTIITVDGCRDEARISCAYDMPDGLSRYFVLNSLSHSTQILDAEVCDSEGWAFGGQWSEGIVCTGTFMLLRKRRHSKAGKETFSINQGDRIRAVRCGKWTKGTVAEICREAGIEMVQSWVDQE